jgi:hypothetical protein
MSSLPTSLRIAFWAIVALWLVGGIALLVGAPRDIVLATAVIGAGAGLVEWMARRPR